MKLRRWLARAKLRRDRGSALIAVGRDVFTMGALLKLLGFELTVIAMLGVVFVMGQIVLGYADEKWGIWRAENIHFYDKVTNVKLREDEK